MMNSCTNIYYEQKIAFLEEENEIIQESYRKSEAVRKAREAELKILSERTVKELLLEAIQKNKKKSQTMLGLASKSGEELTWLIIIDSVTILQTVQSFVKFHPDYRGRILIYDMTSRYNLSGKLIDEVLQILSEYEKDKIKKCRTNNAQTIFAAINDMVNEIETDWILCLGSEVLVISPFLRDMQEVSFLSGCHFINLPVTAQHSMKCLKNRICLKRTYRTEDGKDWLILPSDNASVKEIVPFSQMFTVSSSVFKKDTFVEFGKFDPSFVGMENLEFSIKIFHHHYAIANYQKKVLREQIHQPVPLPDSNVFHRFIIEKCPVEKEQTEEKLRVAIIIDEEGWAFHNIAKELKKNASFIDVTIFSGLSSFLCKF